MRALPFIHLTEIALSRDSDRGLRELLLSHICNRLIVAQGLRLGTFFRPIRRFKLARTFRTPTAGKNSTAVRRLDSERVVGKREVFFPSCLAVIRAGMDGAPESSEAVSSRYATGRNWRFSSSRARLHSLHKVATHKLNNG